MSLWSITSTVASFVYVLLIAGTIVLILSQNRNPVRSLSWVLVLVLLPVIGVTLYVLIGQYFRRDKIISKKSIRKVANRPIPCFDIKEIDTRTLTGQQLNLIKLLRRNNDAAAYPGNKIKVYTDSKEAFEALFAAIESAVNHIHVEFYVFADDRVSNRLRQLLIEKAQQGVRVRMIYDYLGGFTLTKRYIQSLREAGVYVQAFLPVRFRISRIKINYRNHRKIVVVDGKVAFTGGLNIADRYLYGNELGSWRDTFVRFEGMAVHGLQTHFLIDWYFVEQKLITDKKYYPAFEMHDDNLVQVVTSGPDSDWENIMQGIAQAIMTATKYVYMHTPYFIPTEHLLEAIQTAALSGVDVQLMVPKRSDARISDAATRTYLQPILEAGVRVFWYTEGFLHSKAIVIDDMVSTIGSANLDERSANQNFELNAFIYDVETALTLKKAFLEDKKRCSELTLARWMKRSRWERLKESVARLFAPLM